MVVTSFEALVVFSKSAEDTGYGGAGPGPIGLQIHPGLVMQVEFRDLRALAR